MTLVLAENFQPSNLPKTVHRFLFTQLYHLFSLYFNLQLLFLESRRKVMSKKSLDSKPEMINYNL